MHDTALIIFSKPPVPGKVKTRLIPAVGSRWATSIYKELLNKTITRVAKTKYCDRYLYLENNKSNSFIYALRKKYLFKINYQTGNDLGQRLYNAFKQAFRKYKYVIIIGSDCPALMTDDLTTAKERLVKGDDVVLGPAEDGGYYLIGLRANNRILFEGIEWGSGNVLNNTIQRIKKSKLKFSLLNQYWDLDRSTDLLSYLKLKNNHQMMN